MSKKCIVRSLSDKALGELANLIVSTLAYVKYVPDIEEDCSIVMVGLHEYLEKAGATSNIYQDLLRVILCSEYLDANMRFTCMQLLLNNSVSFLATDIFPFPYYGKILQVIAAQGTGLRVLNLKGVYVKEDHMEYMMQIIQKCKNLTKLFCPHIANDELLESIAANSSQLQILDISGGTDVTEIGIECIVRGVCRTKLTVVNIGIPGEENVCYSDIALLLENCPNIETVSTYCFVGSALKFLHDNINMDFKCKLKYLHDTDTDEITLRIIAKTCPNLQSLYLDAPKTGCLHLLKDTKLRKLKLHRFNCAELLQTLETIGSGLDHLTVIKGYGDWKLCKLASLCPTLRALECYIMETLHYTNSTRFQYLEEFEILKCSISHMTLRSFISKSTQLKRLAVDKVTFTDEDITSIFVENDFNKMEDVWFTFAPNLTVQSIEILMDRCPELMSIGQLTGWSLTPDDLALIRGLLKSGNSSLVLKPFVYLCEVNH